jgi:hypothetical protein
MTLSITILSRSTQCHYACCFYAERHYTECRYAECRATLKSVSYVTKKFYKIDPSELTLAAFIGLILVRHRLIRASPINIFCL